MMTEQLPSNLSAPIDSGLVGLNHTERIACPTQLGRLQSGISKVAFVCLSAIAYGCNSEMCTPLLVRCFCARFPLVRLPLLIAQEDRGERSRGR